MIGKIIINVLIIDTTAAASYLQHNNNYSALLATCNLPMQDCTYMLQSREYNKNTIGLVCQ